MVAQGIFYAIADRPVLCQIFWTLALDLYFWWSMFQKFEIFYTPWMFAIN